VSRGESERFRHEEHEGPRGTRRRESV